MSEHSINHLGETVKKILDLLGKFMNQIMEALNHLKKLPDLIADMRQDLNQGFDRLIQSQAEMDIFIRMARLRSKKSLINAENEAISDFENQLNEDLAEIDRRYSKINGELEDECKKRIREIDQHLLDLPNKFPQDLYNTYQKEIIPLFQNLIQDANISYTQRVAAIKIASEKASLVIRKFIKVRNDFFTHVKQYEVPEKIQNSKTYYLPVWLVELNQGDKGITKHAVLPSDFNIKKGQNLNEKPQLKLDSGLGNVAFIQESSDIQQRLIKSFNWKSNNNQKDQIAQNFDKYFKGISLNKRTPLKKAMVKAIQNSNLQTIN